MKKTLLFAALSAAAGICAAQEVGRVVSSSPIQRTVEVPEQVCSTEEVQVQPSQWQSQQNCRTRSRLEHRTVGWNVTYEYAGRRYDTQTSAAPGATIPLRVSAMGVSSLAPPLSAADGGLDAVAGRGTGGYPAQDAADAPGTYSTLPPAPADRPVQVQPGVVVPTTTYSTVRIVQPAPVILAPAYPAYAPYPAYPVYGPAYGGYYPAAPAWGGVPIGLSLGLGYSRGRWR